MMPTAPTYATPVTPTPMGLGIFLSLVFPLISILDLPLHIIHSSCRMSHFCSGLILVEVAPCSQFEVGNSSAIVPNLASKVTAFFIRFDQLETNDLDPTDF